MGIVTIIEAAEARFFTTLEDVKAALGISGGDQDTEINRQIAAVSAQIERITGRAFPNDKVSERLNGDGTQTLVLTRRPILELHSAAYRGGEIDTANIIIDADAGILLRETCWPGSALINNLTGLPYPGYMPDWVIVYTAGYVMPGADNPTLPADIQSIAIDAINMELQRGTRDPGIKSESIGDASYTYTDGGLVKYLTDRLCAGRWLSYGVN